MKSAMSSQLTPSRQIDSSALSPLRFGSAFKYDQSPSKRPRRLSMRMPLIPAINRVVALQNTALRHLRYRTTQGDIDAERFLNEAINVINQCEDPSHSALDEILNSIREIKRDHNLGEFRRIMQANVLNNAAVISPQSPTRIDTIHVAQLDQTPVKSNRVSESTFAPVAPPIPSNPSEVESIDCEIRQTNGVRNPKRWNSLIGLDEAKSRIREMITLRSRFAHLLQSESDGLSGALMFGPPGTGKTSLIKAAADNYGWNAIMISAGDIVSKYCGDSEKRIRSIFKRATELSPCILFIDEIDSLGQARNSETSALSRRILTELMIHLSKLCDPSEDDGENFDQKVIFIAATNEPWTLDGALLRRLPYKIYTPYFNQSEVESLLKLHRPSLMGENTQSFSCCTLRKLDSRRIVNKLIGYSPAEICGILSDSTKAPLREALKDDCVFCIHQIDDMTEQRRIKIHDKDHCTKCYVLGPIGIENLPQDCALGLRKACFCDINDCIERTVRSIQFSIDRYDEWATR